ncbi:MAG: UvrD-helicase domain-containing protein [Prevotella sp.]
MNKALTVYKASAGSGKTFTLAAEYIKLLIRNPLNYRNILAVTFTNKATEEMKMRILSRLYGIWKMLDDSESYIGLICNDLAMTPEAVSQRAGTALSLLIHNYGYFRIETIDAFFQTVLRNLARELDLTPNLRIELNDGQVEEYAVDRLIEELDLNNDLLRLIMEYINKNIDDDKSWNVITQIKAFGKNIFKDIYKENGKEMKACLTEPGYMKNYTKRVGQERDGALQTMVSFADRFLETLADNGLTTDDLAYKNSGVAGFFLKLRNGVFDESIVGNRVADCLENPEKWAPKDSARRDAITALASDTLIPLLAKAIDERPKQWKRYTSAMLTLKHIYKVILLGSIEKKVRELNEDANRFLLSDTQQLLHSLIDGSDTPFIFEKIGTRIEHVMIDEFQDTSSVQWRNFKVLLSECMSREDASNLIVGDVKQSIYRWRSGDWRLLNDIKKQFDNADRTVDVKSLQVNYRSSQRVIMFNNAFFSEAVKHECRTLDMCSEDSVEQLRNAYADVEQRLPDNKTTVADDGAADKGYVSVKLLTKEEYPEATLEELTDTVRRLLESGEKQSDIAILVRLNSNIPVIAEHFTLQMPDVSVISDEAFRLDASTAVTTIIQAMRLLTHPDDLLTRANLSKSYRFTIDNEHNDGDTEREYDCLPEEYVKRSGELAAMPLYELTEELFRIFRLEKLDNQSAYLFAFYDQLNKFALDNVADIDSFLEEWERNICSKTIQSNETEGIRLISIHKSKGLEFDNVIIPFCDWDMEQRRGNVLWCSPREKPFDGLPLVPVDYNKRGLTGTIFENDYKEEVLQNCVDNLNLLYVAFTRAAKRLFVIGRRNAPGSRSAAIENCLPEMADVLEGCVLSGTEDEDGTMALEWGVLPNGGESSRNNDAEGNKTFSANVFTQPSEPIMASIGTYGNKHTLFVQSNNSRRFIEDESKTDDDGGPDSTKGDEYIRRGQLMHYLLSQMERADDLEKALRDMANEGLADTAMLQEMASLIRKRVSSGLPAQWFSGKWRLYNECDILYADADGNVVKRRPDRVMTDGKRMTVVDFKFGNPKDSYREQVKEYIRLLKDMGNENVDGFIWYVYSNKTDKV